MTIRLVEVTADNLDAVCALDAGDGGAQVASNQRSMAQAAVHDQAWPRAIEADGALVGFVMLSDTSLRASARPPHVYCLWRFMIDQRHQGHGLGEQALRQVIEHVKTRPGADALTLSYVPGQAASERLARFYGRMGFVPTGEIDDGEVVMTLALQPLTREDDAMAHRDIAIPTLPSRSLRETLAFYARLGFDGDIMGAADDYAILTRGTLELHFFVHPTLQPAESWAGCYLRVADVDSLYQAFSAAGLPRQGIPRMDTLADKPWGMREFAIVDDDGNLLRIGQEL